MPYKLTVLRAGCCKESTENGQEVFAVSCTITLLQGKHTILVDTGGAWEGDLLKQELGKCNVSPEDVDYVIGTHGHSDHIGNLNMFPSATHIVSFDINKGNKYISHGFNEGCPYAIDEDISVEATPGHTSEDITVFAQTDEYGLAAVAGDIFESEADLEMPEKWQSQSQFPVRQQQSRMKIMRRADYIIPGHGSLFKVSKAYKEDPHMIMVEMTKSMEMNDEQ